MRSSSSRPLRVLTPDRDCSGFKAESLAAYLKANAEIPLKFSRPVDKMKVILTGAMLGGSIVGGVTMWPMLKKGLTSTFVWSSLTMVRSAGGRRAGQG